MYIRPDKAYDSVYSPQGKLDGISHPMLFGEILPP
jgi:hypothetical protein